MESFPIRPISKMRFCKYYVNNSKSERFFSFYRYKSAKSRLFAAISKKRHSFGKRHSFFCYFLFFYIFLLTIVVKSGKLS